MDNKDPKQQNPSAISSPTNKAQSPIPNTTDTKRSDSDFEIPVISAADALINEDMHKKTRKALMIGGIVVVIVVILLSVAVFQIVHDLPSKHVSKTNDSVNNSSQNPLNNNGSINSQVKYCSNPINAATVC